MIRSRILKLGRGLGSAHPVHFLILQKTNTVARTKKAASKKKNPENKSGKNPNPKAKKSSKKTDKRAWVGSEDFDATILFHLPYLFDGSRGYLAWIPVEFDDDSNVTHEVVVISIRMLESYFGMKTKFQMPTSYLDKFFDFLPDYPVIFSDLEFRRMSLKTPFRGFRMGADDAPECLRRDFKVVEVPRFKSLIVDSRKTLTIGNPPRRLKGRTAFIGTRYALYGAKDSTGAIPELSGLDISYEDKQHLPAMGVPFWTQLYTPIIKRFFGMQKDRHVVGGFVATKPCKVKKFEPELQKEVKAFCKRRRLELQEAETMKRIRDEPTLN